MTVYCDDIKRFLPQREPMLMLDSFSINAGTIETIGTHGTIGTHETSAPPRTAPTEADASLHVLADNLFFAGGRFMEAGIVEHIAQTAAALAGYNAALQREAAPLAMLGEVRQLRLYFLPSVGDVLQTHIRIVTEVMGVTLLEAVTTREGRQVAECRMKIGVAPLSTGFPLSTGLQDLQDLQDLNLNKVLNLVKVDNDDVKVESADYYKILHTHSESPAHVRFTVRLEKDFKGYAGHFPGKPVAPGVCNIRMIKELAEKMTGKRLLISSIAKCRFLNVIDPLNIGDLTVDISLQPFSMASFDGKEVCSALAVICDADDLTYVEFKGELTSLT